MATYAFDAIIEASDKGGMFVKVPFSVPETFGKKGQVKIKATIDGEPYRGVIASMGGEGHFLIVVKAIRDKIGKTAGDPVHVELKEDTEPRTVVLPAELVAAFKEQPGLAATFNAMAYTHQKEYVEWIEGAKKAETRERRVRKAIEMISKGEKIS